MRVGGTLRLGVWAALVALVVARPQAGPPPQDPAPLPDRQHFISEAKARVASNMARQAGFSCRERVTDVRFNPFGRMGTRGVAVADVYPGATEALTYRRIVERDGRPVPAEQLADQDRAYRARLDEWHRQLAREGRSERQARQRREIADRTRDEARLGEALDLYDFTIEGRETLDGRSAIVIAFSPRPNARARSREGRIARSFAGRVWIDEADRELMRADARAVDDVAFGYGLIARLNRGTTAMFARRKIDGVWRPIETRFQATGRALLVRRVDIDFSRTYSDYRPFDPSGLAATLGWR